MKQIIYVSTASLDVELGDVQKIISEAIPFNKSVGITGLLAYNGKYFIQCMEGEDEAIDNLYNKVALDKRHCDVQTIGYKQISQRSFDDWNMGLVNDSNVIADVIEDECEFREFDVYNFEYFQAHNILRKLSFLV